MSIQPQDLYLKISDPSGKYSEIIASHRVWNRERFIAAQIGLHAKPEKEEDRRIVTVASQAEYRRANGYKQEHCQ